MTTDPDTGQFPLIVPGPTFVKVQFCDVPATHPYFVFIDKNRNDKQDYLAEYMSLKLKDASPTGPFVIRDGDKLTIPDVKPLDQWQESKQKSKAGSSWRLVRGHMSISYGWPTGKTKLPKEANNLQLVANADTWSFLPVGDDDGDGKASSVRFKLNGKPGTKGNVSLFLPKALVKKWNLSTKNLAAFVNGKRVKSTRRRASNNQGLTVSLNFIYPIKTVSIGKTR